MIVVYSSSNLVAVRSNTNHATNNSNLHGNHTNDTKPNNIHDNDDTID